MYESESFLEVNGEKKHAVALVLMGLTSSKTDMSANFPASDPDGQYTTT